MQIQKFMHFYLAFFFPKLSIRFYCFHHGGGNGHFTGELTAGQKDFEAFPKRHLDSAGESDSQL